jgi:hypothetical protein
MKKEEKLKGKGELKKEEIEEIVRQYLNERVSIEVRAFSGRILYIGLICTLIGLFFGIAIGLHIAQIVMP